MSFLGVNAKPYPVGTLTVKKNVLSAVMLVYTFAEFLSHHVINVLVSREQHCSHSVLLLPS